MGFEPCYNAVGMAESYKNVHQSQKESIFKQIFINWKLVLELLKS